ncbi:MAG TPA: LPS assembly protein LptD, partial [Micavibrio sp.]
PEMQASFLGDPGKTFGGRWSVDVSMLGLRREAGGQDMNRAVLQTGWERRLVSDSGLLTTVNLDLRGDAYYVRDRDIAPAGSGRRGQGSEVRGFARGHLVTSYPVVKPMAKAQLIIEPIAALTVAPDINASSSNIPNEDSQDVQLDASNLFEPDRFPGLDRVEDQSHATYGVRTGVYGYGGSKGEVFVGQSYRLNDNTNPFPEGSGLAGRHSDLVGQITASYKNRFGLNYRFQVDQDDYSSRRHEVDANVKAGRVEAGARYLFARELEGTDLDDNREQVQGVVSYRVSDAWHVRSSIIQDLGNDPGMRKANLGVDYEGQCMSLSGTLRRNLARDSSGESNTEILFRVGLKNIGDFTTSAIPLDGAKPSADETESSR